MFKYLLFQIGHVLVNILPLSVSRFLARILCDCHYVLSVADRRYVTKNLKIICGEGADIPKLTREVFHNFGIYLIEFFRLKKMLQDDYIRENLVIENMDALQKVRDSGRGVIILTAHLGNWEYGGVLMGKFGYPLTIIALAHQQHSVTNYFNEQRKMTGNRIVQTNTAIRACTEVLKEGGQIAIAADRDFTNTGDVVNFLGRKSRLPKGAALFSLRLDVPIITSFLIREGNGKYRMSFEEPIYPTEARKLANKEDQVHFLMETYLKKIEAKIRRYPSQWLMFREFALE
jgi:Kdo2-lipid IVA lauroyltransferase/acyltransferase